MTCWTTTSPSCTRSRAADDVRLARLREGLFAEQPKRRPRGWIGTAAAAVAVMMIAGLVVFVRPADRTTPAVMPVAPATSLSEAAALLEVSQDPPAKYRHTRYQIWQTLGTGLTEVTSTGPPRRSSSRSTCGCRPPRAS